MNMEQEVTRLIALMAQVEGICEQHGFKPPVEITVTEGDGQVWEFDYAPERESVEILPSALRLPIILRFRDTNGRSAQVQITDFALRPEWMKRFLQ
jgi:hypothetical protein